MTEVISRAQAIVAPAFLLQGSDSDAANFGGQEDKIAL